MSDQRTRAARFLELHHQAEPLLLPNPWDVGTAVALESLGFQALATTSAGFAATLGRLDNTVSVDEALAHCEAVVAAVDVPVSADFEGGFAIAPAEVAANVVRAKATGLAGCSIEDSTGDSDDPVFDPGLARERVEAAAAAAHGGDVHLVLTARAENILVGRNDLADTIQRLQSYQEAGADVLYAPGLVAADDIRSVVESIDLPLNVLVLGGLPPVGELAALGVKRVSVGSGLSLVALGAMADAARELLDSGTYATWTQAATGRALANQAFAGRR